MIFLGPLVKKIRQSRVTQVFNHILHVNYVDLITKRSKNKPQRSYNKILAAMDCKYFSDTRKLHGFFKALSLI